jgi:hypothetical protein
LGTRIAVSERNYTGARSSGRPEGFFVYGSYFIGYALLGKKRKNFFCQELRVVVILIKRAPVKG